MFAAFRSEFDKDGVIYLNLKFLHFSLAFQHIESRIEQDSSSVHVEIKLLSSLLLKAQAQPDAGLSQITWLNENGRFYTHSAIMDGDSSVLFTQIGANDPLFNLRNENAFITRKSDAINHTFVSVLEPHGEYNPSKEFTVSAVSEVKKLSHQKINNIDVVELAVTSGQRYVLAFNAAKNFKGKQSNSFVFNGAKYRFNGRFKLFEINN